MEVRPSLGKQYRGAKFHRGWHRFALLLALIAARAAPVPASAAERGSELRIFLLTMGPGDRVWERFGHNALWIHDPVGATDRAYNYGIFDFQQENFLFRFIQGRMRYWVEGIPLDQTLEVYRRANRAVWAQEPNLTRQQKAELRDFLQWNARPENRYYRYDYYRDNCSTRLRGALNAVLGGQIAEETRDVSSGTTYPLAHPPVDRGGRSRLHGTLPGAGAAR